MAATDASCGLVSCWPHPVLPSGVEVRVASRDALDLLGHALRQQADCTSLGKLSLYAVATINGDGQEEMIEEALVVQAVM